MDVQRRHDLDWIRVLVFTFLIFFHVGMFFVPWDWHLKNNEVSESFILPMWFVNQWRLPVLFIISGMGTRFALSSRNWKQYLTERHNRLVIPLIFGMIVVVAPQVYTERMVDGAGYESFWEFYPDYFKGVYPQGNFSWHHLWFLPYLFVYSVILLPVFIWIRSSPGNKLMKLFRKKLHYNSGFIFLAIPLILADLLLKPNFPVMNNLIEDWYAFTYYLILFMYGYLFISAGKSFWQSISHKKFTALIVGITTFSLMAWINRVPDWNMTIEILYAVIRITNLGSWCIVIFGYGAAMLNRSSAVLSYCNQAVYPFYIAHQTITVIAAYYIYDLDWPVTTKFIFLAVVTFSGSWIVFEIVRRIPLLRPLFGLKPR